jgi:glycosyltransferase involved in cell wall biosynthesis
VVADGRGNANDGGVKIIDVGLAPGRMARMLTSARRVLAVAQSLDAHIYHLHDPELIPAGLKLKRLGKKVIFDAHEDVPAQLLSKAYLWPPSRRLVSRAFSAFEQRACPRFDRIVAATPAIRDKFLTINPNTVDINNFPVPGELDDAVPWQEKKAEVCYVGAINRIRGIQELVRACEQLRSDVRLNLVGAFAERGVENEVGRYPGWNRVNALGVLDRSELRAILGRSLAGLVTFHHAPNHINAQPNKMFEYMSAGIPVIASDFPLWREIVHGSECGLCVDPRDPAAIAHAIDALASNPEMARRMGENGRRSILHRYNWSIEEQKLHAVYRSLA